MRATDQLPTGWERTTLGNVFRWGSGGTPRKGTPGYYDGCIPWAIIGDLTDGVVENTASTITARGLEESAAKWVEPDSVLVAMYGSIGKLGINSIRLTTNQAIAFTKPDLMPAKYLFYYLMAERSSLINQGKGGTQSNISQTVLKAYPFVVAPLLEQHRIVEAIESYLTRLDAAVALLERVQRNLKRYRASVLKAAVEGRLVPTEAELARKERRDYEPASELLKRILVERRKKWIENAAEKARAKVEKKAREAGKLWTHADDVKTLEKERAKAAKKYKEPATPDTSTLPALPEGWCWTSLDSLCVSITDGDHAAPPQVEDGIPFLVIGNVRDGKISFRETRHVPSDYYNSLDITRRPQKGDILYTVTGSFGIPIYVNTDHAFCVQRHIGILRCAPGSDPLFLSRVLASDFIYQQATTVATGTAQKTVGLKKLRYFAIPLPPRAEQVRIFKSIEASESIAQNILNTITQGQSRLAKLRQAILKWAFEGKLVPQDPNDEPASVLLERIKAERESMQPRKRRRTIRKKKDEPTGHDEQLDLLGGTDT